MWIITKDIINGGYHNGIGFYKNTALERFLSEGTPFRIFDDDGILYYEGRFIETEDSTGFEPLHDFAMGEAGATEIHYWSDRAQTYVIL